MVPRDWLLDMKAAGPPSEAQLAALNVELERRIAERIGELEALNAQLTVALEQRTEAQEAQARSEAHFRAAFDSDAVGQVHYDPATGAIIRANRCYAAMLGYDPEELVGRRGSDFTHPDDKTREPYARMLEGTVDRYSREKRYLRRDGTAVWGRVSASIVRLPESGEPLLAVAVVEDVDDRHRAQEALRQAKHDLELMVDERTAALAQRDLLLREVYHRVKNNLQVVDSLLRMQGQRLADPDAKAALETLRSRIYALGLVHHQLMGSKDLETFEIAPFLEELSAHLLEGAGGGGVSLSVRAAPLRVGLDFAIPLGLLVTELVTHAFKHDLAESRGAITVVLEEVGDGQLELCVADDIAGGADREVDSMAARIIAGLVQQLRGSLERRRDGLATVVRLPAPVRP
jgi:PAS domain S-box-containing protein